jgi:hypothetical protein
MKIVTMIALIMTMILWAKSTLLIINKSKRLSQPKK